MHELVVYKERDSNMAVADGSVWAIKIRTVTETCGV
jgi:hypothetical protein